MKQGENRIRRSQLVMTYGPGSLVITPQGETVLVAGLDWWFERWPNEDQNIEVDELTFHDRRLEQRLAVDCFRLPPDYRSSTNGSNRRLPVPVLRFPRWHVCSLCGQMRCFGPVDVWSRSNPEPKCCVEQTRYRRYQAVPLLAVCDNGHIQDFPFRQWVHEDPYPACRERMHLRDIGATIERQRVTCQCGANRRLREVLEFSVDSDPPHSVLSDKLDPQGEPYLCRGLKAWVGAVQEPCGRPLVGILSTATNLYYPDVRSSLFVPPHAAVAPDCPAEVLDGIAHPSLQRALEVVHGKSDDETIKNLMKRAGIGDASLEHVRSAIAFVRSKWARDGDIKPEKEYDERSFRRDEYNLLSTSTAISTEFLRTEPVDPGGLAWLFSRITLVHRLRESRVLVGFSRLRPSASESLREKKRLLWRSMPGRRDQWLPGCFVHGEGVFLELHPSRVVDLERRWRQPTSQHYRPRAWDPSATFVALHTLAHLLIRRLSFACGYSAASLRERLYVLTADEPKEGKPLEMHGVLIYTASGDSEGSMGGLVRACSVEALEYLLNGVIDDAAWCPADPVCRETRAERASEASSNSWASCHACCHLPETSCECWNTYLHRSLLVSDHGAVDGLLIRG